MTEQTQHDKAGRHFDGANIDELIEEFNDSHRRPRWHVGRDIPIALILAIAAQTGGAVWWASALSSKLDRAIEQIQEFKQDRYTKDDGRRDQALVMQMLESFRQADRDLERRVFNCESHVGALNGQINPKARQ